MQGNVGGAPSKYSGIFRTIFTIFSEEGVGGLYRGLIPGLQRQLAFSTIKLGCYDDVKDMYSSLIFSGNFIRSILNLFLQRNEYLKAMLVHFSAKIMFSSSKMFDIMI